MLSIALKMQEYVAKRIREMIQISLVDLRKLELIHDSTAQRSYLSGKLAAYEEMLKIIDEN